MARQPDGGAEKRNEIRRLHRLGFKPREIVEKTGFDSRYVRDTLNKYEYGPGARQAQLVQATYEMMAEAIVILRQLNRLRPGVLRRRIEEINDSLLEPTPAPKKEVTIDMLAALLSGNNKEG